MPRVDRSKKPRASSRKSLPPKPGVETADEDIAGGSSVLENGEWRLMTPEEQARVPRGRIFIGIGGFKPPAGIVYNPDPIRPASDLEE